MKKCKCNLSNTTMLDYPSLIVVCIEASGKTFGAVVEKLVDESQQLHFVIYTKKLPDSLRKYRN